MARIQFRAKPRVMYNPDDSIAYRYVDVPNLTRSHCDMSAFRQHEKYRGYANSDLFPAMLERIANEVFSFGYGARRLRLDKIPKGVVVDESGFLATVSFEV